MKTTELIELLQKSLRDNGDLLVVMPGMDDLDGWFDVGSLETAISMRPAMYGSGAQGYIVQKEPHPDQIHVNVIDYRYSA